MSNKVENNEEVRVSTEKAYYDTNDMQGQMLRYRTNSLSYKLGMGGILFSLLAAFISLNSLVWNVSVIVKILGNIVILLFGFLSIEKAKSYSKEYSFVLCGIGGVCIGRIFWCPLQIMIWYGKYINNLYASQYATKPSDGKLVADLEARDAAEKIVESAKTHLSPAVYSSKTSNAYLPQSGNFRGIAAIVLLGIAAALFFGAGIIGLIKAKRYAEYMQTQDTTKGV
ncbi:MAG: hypothetical protein K2I77_06690 [Anaeroplasmataceae bacterium]|nr:hypothetical protein [Anaeroplasmataceae bacterium]